MRHQKNTTILGRKSGPRKALLRSLSISLIENGRVQTTPAKARAVRRMVEKLITKAQTKDVHTIRMLERKLNNKKAALRLVNELGPQFAQRPGGYTRMTKVQSRKGDGAKQVILEFITE